MPSQSTSLTFCVPGRHRTMLAIEIDLSEDPETIGHHLLFPTLPLSTFIDFPICRARIHASDDVGYAATYGWIQMVREAPLTETANAKWAMDPVPLTEELNTPFVWFGPEAQLFDAPFRMERNDLDWTCRSFLTYVEDAVLSKVVRPVLVFEWGFKIEGGGVSIKMLRMLDAKEVWEQHRVLLEAKFGGWRFEAVDSAVEVDLLP